MHTWFRRRSVFVMLLCIFLAAIAPMYVLGFGIYSWGYDMTRQEITNGLNSSVSFYLQTLEAEVMRIRRLQYECLNDQDLFYYVNASHIMTQAQRFEALLALQRRLSVMRDSSNYIQDVRVYLPRNDRIISATGGVDPLSDAWKPITKAKADTPEAGVVYLDNRLYLVAAYPILPADPDATPLYILIIELSQEMIRSLILPFNHYEGGGTVLFNADQQYELKSGTDADIVEAIEEDADILDVLRIEGQTGVKRDGESYLVVSRYSSYLNMDLIAYTPEKQIYQGIWRYQRLFVYFSAVALVVVVMFSISSYWLIRRPMKILTRSLRKVEGGDLSERIEHRVSDEYAKLYSSFNRMAESLEQLFVKNNEQQLLTQRAELRQLQSQINPHFLHNAFFLLYRMAKDEDYEDITEFLTLLSEYYRFITRNAQMDVTLIDETKHAYGYARIQKMRFGRRIGMRLEELPTEYAELMVPRLILQPVLENAFEHGLKDVIEGGLLTLGYEREADALVIVVENNGAELSPAEMEVMQRRLGATGDHMECTGILNIHRRLQMKFGPRSGLRLSHRHGGGLRVELVLTIRTEDAHVPCTGR